MGGATQPWARTEKETRKAPVILEKEQQEGEGRDWQKETSWLKQRSTKETLHASESRKECSEQAGMRIPTDRGPLALKMLLVVKLKCIHQNFKFDYVNAKKTKNRYHVKVLPRRVRHLKDLVHRLKEVKATFTILHHSLGEQKSSCVKVIILHKNG